MKNSTSILAVAAMVGLSALTATPANATIGAYPNCSAAAAAGASNILRGTPGYGPHLDSDSDGIGCETQGSQAAPAPGPVVHAPSQVAQLPIGGADTGVTEQPDNDNEMGILALGSLAVAGAGGALIVRRRLGKQAWRSK
jgi:Excalibur calcium-binding domain